jgi:hypothetical protein
MGTKLFDFETFIGWRATPKHLCFVRVIRDRVADDHLAWCQGSIRDLTLTHDVRWSVRMPGSDH